MLMAQEKILIVDDDAILAMYLQESLKWLGYDVAGPVATADEAIASAGEIHPDLILMDINLRGRMNGIQAAGQIRGLCDAAIIFLTGYSQDTLIQEVKDIGPYGYLIKPVSEHELAATIETALYKHDLDRKLKESEERYHRITAAVTDYIFTVEVENGRAVRTTHRPACEGVTGYTAEELTADPNLWVGMVPEPDRAAVRKQAEDILEGRAFEAVEHRIIRKDSGLRWVRETPVPHYDKNGRLISYDGLVQDITGRKQAEDAQRISKEQYQTLFETSPDPIIMSNLKGEFIMVNRQAARLYGVETPEVFIAEVGSFMELLDEDGRNRARQRIESLVKAKNVPKSEYSFKTKDGNIIIGEVNTSVLSDRENKPVALLSVIHDITRRKRMEDAIRNSEERFRTLVERMQDSLIILDFSGRVLFANPAAARLVGLRNIEEVIGDTITRYLHPESLEQAMLHLEDIRQGKDVLSTEYHIITKDGRNRWVEGLGTKISYQGGQSDLVLLRDITERRQLQDALREREENLRSLFNNMTEGVALHEMIMDEADMPIDYRIIEINPQYENILGLRKEDVRGKNATAIYGSPQAPYLDVYAKVAQTGISMKFETYYAPFNKYFEISVAPWGKNGFTTIFSDITDRKRAQEELRTNEERYRTLVETQTEFISRFKPDGTIVFVNEVLQRFLGKPENELVGRILNFMVYPEDLPMIKSRLSEISQSDPVVVMECRLVSGTGEINWIQFVNRGLYDHEGTLVEIQSVGRDITERKRAEDALRVMLAKYQVLFESFPLGITIMDKKGYIVEGNKKSEELLGISIDDQIKNVIDDKQWRTIRTDGTPMPTYEYAGARALKENRIVKNVEMGIVKGDDDVTWINVTAAPIPLEDLGVVITYSDITERKQSDEALRASKAKLEAVFDSMNDAVFISDIYGNFIDFNKAFAAYYRFGSKEECFRRLAEFPEYVEIYFADGTPAPVDMWSVPRALRGETVSNVEYILRKKETGDIWWGSYSFGPIRNSDGSIIGCVVVARDITERKLAEEELMRLASAIEQADECVVITDTMGAIQYVNPSFEKITGYSKDDAIGQNPRILRSGMQDEAFYHELWTTITRGDTWSGRFVNRRRNGTLYYEDASISPVRDKTGNIVSYVAVKKDITKEVKLEEQLLRSQKLEAIGTLAGGIAHDFNNILSAIIGFSEVVKEEVPRKSPAFEHIIEVLRAGERARDLVRQILTFSRQVESARTPVKVQLIARETIKLLRSSIPKNITIIDRIKPRTAPVEGDPTRIHQVIMNLCTNAYHSMIPNGGEMTISLTDIVLDGYAVRGWPTLKPGPHLCLVVSDTGCGMDDATVKRIFDPFFTTKEKGKGTGLGLAMVYGIVTELGGVISVASTPGRGSSFTIYLPVTERLTEAKGDEFEEDEEVMESGRILVVDDEESIIHFTQIMLEQLGYTVTALNSGMDALTLFRADPDRFDLIMIDQVMPEMNGTRLAVEVLKIRPDMPILLMTGYSETIDREGARALGIREYLEKPFTKKAISQIIRSML